MIFKTKYKVAKKLSKEFSYSYSDIKKLQKDCNLTDDQLKKVVELANEDKFALSIVSDVLLSFEKFITQK